MSVHYLKQYIGKPVSELVDSLKALSDARRLKSLQFVAEVEGVSKPLTGIAGNYRRNPDAAIQALREAQGHLDGFIAAQKRFLADQEPRRRDFGSSV